MHHIPRTCEVTSVAAATLEQVWAVLADVTRVGEWSHECRMARWRGHESGPRVGARFRGRNRNGIFGWSRWCRIVRVEPPTILAWRTTGVAGLLDSTLWEFTLVPESAGRTRIEQRYRVVRVFPPLALFYATVIKEHRDRTRALRADLERLGQVASREPPTSGLTGGRPGPPR